MWFGMHLARRRRVLVVYDAAYPESLEVANYYRAQRGIPASNACAINVANRSWVDLATYERAIKSPIRQCLNAVGNDNILYVVLSYATSDVVSDNFAIFSSRSVDQLIVDVWERGLVQLGQLQRRIQLRRRRHRLAPGQLLVGLVARCAGPGHYRDLGRYRGALPRGPHPSGRRGQKPARGRERWRRVPA